LAPDMVSAAQGEGRNDVAASCEDEERGEGKLGVALCCDGQGRGWNEWERSCRAGLAECSGRQAMRHKFCVVNRSNNLNISTASSACGPNAEVWTGWACVGKSGELRQRYYRPANTPLHQVANASTAFLHAVGTRWPKRLWDLSNRMSHAQIRTSDGHDSSLLITSPYKQFTRSLVPLETQIWNLSVLKTCFAGVNSCNDPPFKVRCQFFVSQRSQHVSANKDDINRLAWLKDQTNELSCISLSSVWSSFPITFNSVLFVC